MDSNQFGREKMKKCFLLKSMKAFVLDIASSFWTSFSQMNMRVKIWFLSQI